MYIGVHNHEMCNVCMAVWLFLLQVQINIVNIIIQTMHIFMTRGGDKH